MKCDFLNSKLIITFVIVLLIVRIDTKNSKCSSRDSEVLNRCFTEYYSKYNYNLSESYTVYSTKLNEQLWSSYSTAMNTVCNKTFKELKYCLGNAVLSNCLNPESFVHVMNATHEDSSKMVENYIDLDYICTNGAHVFQNVYNCSKTNNLYEMTINQIVEPSYPTDKVQSLVNTTINTGAQCCDQPGEAFVCNLMAKKLRVYYNSSKERISIFCIDVEDYGRGYSVVTFNFYIFISIYIIFGLFL